MKKNNKKEKVELKTKEELKEYSKKYHIWMLVVFVAVALLAVVGYFLMKDYEQGILEIYAEQQDNYVQLVVDQINIQDNRTDAEIITEIIDTLDSGNSHYWTLSKGDTIIYVKNVLETNKYQGIDADTYFGTSTPSEFFDTFKLNRVKHMIVEIDGVRYVASGVLFEYDDQEYRICLLTDENIIFDNNDFLVNKVEMCLYASLLLIGILIVALWLQNIVQKRRNEIFDYDKKIRKLHKEIQELEEEISMIDFYDSRWNTYNFRLINRFLDKMYEKNIDKLSYVDISFEDNNQCQEFLSSSELILGNNVLRFRKSDNMLALIFVYLDDKQVEKLLSKIDLPYKEMSQIIYMEKDPEQTYSDKLESINE